MKRIEPVVIVHGGAWDIPVSRHAAHKRGVRTALNAAQCCLQKNDDAIEAVLDAVRALESDAAFDAGYGSFLNSEGEVEMDAGLMVGKDRSMGAVAAIKHVEHPIDAANLVRTKSQHTLLVAEGAEAFARNHGVPYAETGTLLVGREKRLYRQLQKESGVRIKSFFEEKNRPSDTVGAVAIDSRGRMCAATSTGGTPFKLAGRVGDSPLPGAGFYADDRVGAVSSTGWGEGIMRVLLAKSAVDALERLNGNAEEAARLAIGLLKQEVDGDGGLILIAQNGKAAFYHNTPYMAVGAANIDEVLFVSMGKSS